VLRFPLLYFGIIIALPALGIADDPLPTLTSARELRNLPATEAARSYPVHLHAVITLVEPQRTIFLRDDTGAGFIRWSNGLPDLKAGERVDVEGVSYPGLYLTGIVGKKVTILSEDEPLPPRPVDYEQLASGQFHYDWVEVQGVVRSVTPGEKYSVLKLALGNGSLDVYPTTDETFSAENLVDATVRVDGIAAGYINDRRQLVAPHLRIRSLTDVTVLEPAPEKPFDIATTPASELLRFAPNGRAGHRVKVRGVVTYQEPGSAIYLRDNVQGLRVHTATTDPFSPGETVEALGFPTMGTLSAELQDATLRRTGETTFAAPVAVKATELASGKFDADLVQIDADVRDIVREADRTTLTLQSGNTVFQAIAHPPLPESELPEPGARVRLSGICHVIEATQPSRSFSAHARAFEVLLRNTGSDFTVLRRPSWWTTQRLAVAAAALLGLVVLSLAWAASLRRQVRRQTTVIRSQIEAATIADERQRIAREFHDTLEQELVGVTLRIEAAATRARDSRLRELLSSTHRLVQQLQTGARSFVWNLRDSSLTTQPLAEAIRTAVAGSTTGHQLEIRTLGEARRLPESIAHELLRVAQEACTNSVKHGAAHTIKVTLDFTTPACIRLQVEDDGRGFDADAPVPAGHFGLLGIRERVQKLGGEFHLQSEPNKGAAITVTVPAP